MTILALIFLVALVSVTALSFRHGGRDEMLAAIAIVSATFLTPIVQGYGFTEPEMGIVLVDIALFLALTALAMRSSAFWPMWAAGFQLCALSVHLAAAQMPHMMPAAYAETLVIWSYPVLAALGFGTWFEAGKRHGQS